LIFNIVEENKSSHFMNTSSKNPSRFYTVFLVLFFSSFCLSYAQDPKRFQEEIDTIDLKYSKIIKPDNLIVFTGSSSVRRWKNINDYFPSKNIINTGFGGSQMSDLLYYCDSLITKYKPVQVFIYEGDNDISAGKKPIEVLKDAEALISKITSIIPGIQIVIISVKPSVLRWKLKDEYISLNNSYKSLCMTHKNLKFVDVWSPLLNKDGNPKKEIFISDSLHINKIGYDIWAREIKKSIK
jgi:lysophospholipase L1-like esterase